MNLPLTAQRILAALVVVVLLAVNALTRQTTTILEPPTRAKAIAVTGDRVDAAWLEEMGAWVAHMMLDTSPASVAWQQEQILRWTHPSTHGQLQQEMAVQAKRIRDTNASTVFWAQQVAPDPERQRVVVAMRDLDGHKLGAIYRVRRSGAATVPTTSRPAASSWPPPTSPCAGWSRTPWSCWRRGPTRRAWNSASARTAPCLRW